MAIKTKATKSANNNWYFKPDQTSAWLVDSTATKTKYAANKKAITKVDFGAGFFEVTGNATAFPVAVGDVLYVKQEDSTAFTGELANTDLTDFYLVINVEPGQTSGSPTTQKVYVDKKTVEVLKSNTGAGVKTPTANKLYCSIADVVEAKRTSAALTVPDKETNVVEVNLLGGRKDFLTNGYTYSGLTLEIYKRYSSLEERLAHKFADEDFQDGRYIRTQVGDEVELYKVSAPKRARELSDTDPLKVKYEFQVSECMGEVVIIPDNVTQQS